MSPFSKRVAPVAQDEAWQRKFVSSLDARRRGGAVLLSSTLGNRRMQMKVSWAFHTWHRACQKVRESCCAGSCWGGRLLEVFSWSGEIGVAERLSDFYHY